MIKLWGRRGLAAAVGTILTFGSGAASAQSVPNTPSAERAQSESIAERAQSESIAERAQSESIAEHAKLVQTSYVLPTSAGAAANATASEITTSSEITTASDAVTASQIATASHIAPPTVAVRALPAAVTDFHPVPAPTSAVAAFRPVTATIAQPRFVKEAAWLRSGGWPLLAMVERYATSEQMGEEMTCLATAVFFEARGESAEGQLAVARVVMNRASSGRYPPSWCATVKQPWQFSFVHNGQFPSVDPACAAWRRAQSVAKLAAANIFANVSGDVLWYHADYVAPSWGQRMQRVEKIGAHIFYRA